MNSASKKCVGPTNNDALSTRRWRQLACASFLVGACVALARSSGGNALQAANHHALLTAPSGDARVGIFAAVATKVLPSPGVVAAATVAATTTATEASRATYARQRKAGDQLLALMRAEPHAWERGYYHTASRALWVVSDGESEGKGARGRRKETFSTCLSPPPPPPQ